MRFLLDTNILSEPVVAKPNPFVLEKIRVHSTSLAIASVTWHEALYGLLLLPPGGRREQIADYLFRRVRPSLPIIAFDEQAARWQAEERARLRKSGRTPSYADSQIAAIAAVNELVLVTRNIEAFADFHGLRTANWFEENEA
jgi:tRNA(fMet)-specific endonuclease VapC